MTDIESIYGALCMKSLIGRRSRCFHNMGTGDLATIGRAHYHRPSINQRLCINTLTGGAGRDVGGTGGLVAQCLSHDR